MSKFDKVCLVLEFFGAVAGILSLFAGSGCTYSRFRTGVGIEKCGDKTWFHHPHKTYGPYPKENRS